MGLRPGKRTGAGTRRTSARRKPKGSDRGVIVTKGMPLHEVLQVHPETLKVFVHYDMTCLGDENQHSMTIQSWALDHGIDESVLLRQLNASAGRRHSSRRKASSHRGL